MNLFKYVSNNPSNLVDPYGLQDSLTVTFPGNIFPNNQSSANSGNNGDGFNINLTPQNLTPVSFGSGGGGFGPFVPIIPLPVPPIIPTIPATPAPAIPSNNDDQPNQPNNDPLKSKLDDCIDICTPTLPTCDGLGWDFWNCVNKCMAE